MRFLQRVKGATRLDKRRSEVIRGEINISVNDLIKLAEEGRCSCREDVEGEITVTRIWAREQGFIGLNSMRSIP